MLGIKNIYQYCLFAKKNQHLVECCKKIYKSKLKFNCRQVIQKFLSTINQYKMKKLKFKINNDQKIIIVLGIGGSGPTKNSSQNIYKTYSSNSNAYW